MKLQDTLNAELRDAITGFTGIGIGYAVYATGCNTVCLAPRVDKEGKRREAEWFDIERIELAIAETGPIRTRSGSGGPSTKSEIPPTK